MSTIVNVTRYHLVDWIQILLLPWLITVVTFLVNLVIFMLLPTPDAGFYSGGLGTMYIFLLIVGALLVTRSLPFGLAMGASRRSYYLGSTFLVGGMGIAFGLALAVLQVLERVTGGWGLTIHFFRVPWLLDGPWYLTWLTSAVLLVLLSIYGMWFGLVYRRWNVIGTVTFIVGQVFVLLAAAVLITWLQVWPALGSFFTALSALGLTAVLAAIAAALAIGGFITMRRVTV